MKINTLQALGVFWMCFFTWLFDGQTLFLSNLTLVTNLPSSDDFKMWFQGGFVFEENYSIIVCGITFLLCLVDIVGVFMGFFMFREKMWACNYILTISLVMAVVNGLRITENDPSFHPQTFFFISVVTVIFIIKSKKIKGQCRASCKGGRPNY